VLVLVGQQQFGLLAQPVFRNLREQIRRELEEASEISGKHAIEAIEVRFVLHQAHARKVVKLIHAVRGNALAHGFQQREELFDGDRDATFFELEKKNSDTIAPQKTKKITKRPKKTKKAEKEFKSPKGGGSRRKHQRTQLVLDQLSLLLLFAFFAFLG